MRKQFVYTVTMHYDEYDHFRVGIAATLPIAKRLAQKEYTAYELPDVAPTLKWASITSGKSWYAPVNAYGREYQIHKNEVITS